MPEGQSIGFRAEEGPTVFSCKDFASEKCCKCCHSENFVIALYPWSVYSVGKHRMPDLGMGLRAEICCGLFDSVRSLPRDWWIHKYAEKKGWSPQEAELLCQAGPKNYYKVWGQIADSHYAKSAPARPRTVSSRNSGLRSRLRSATACPACGSTWDSAICNQCGYEG